MTTLTELVDPLGEALHHLRMRGVFYSRCELAAPWGIDLPAIADSLMFHVVIGGSCWLEIGEAKPMRLQPGDLVLAPHGDGHRLWSEPGAPTPGLFELPRDAVSERYEVIRVDGSGEPTRLLCGTVYFNHPAARQLTTLLPPVILVQGWRSAESEWIASTLRLMASEARSPRPGGEEVITRLADILVIQAIRVWLEQEAAATPGWLSALRDPQVGRALAMIHRDPAQEWRVDNLAAAVAMSRSAFAERFSRLVGEAPMQYVTRWRMYLALDALREDRATVAEIAIRLGYGSEAAFSRAFKRFAGLTPGAARRGTTTA
ncbi:MAG: AraC family transcriptional regulator [Thermomicrobiales bacterium]|nr:AraC family transcriptional regulator [Thermomicrobiales bacterium]